MGKIVTDFDWEELGKMLKETEVQMGVPLGTMGPVRPNWECLLCWEKVLDPETAEFETLSFIYLDKLENVKKYETYMKMIFPLTGQWVDGFLIGGKRDGIKTFDPRFTIIHPIRSKEEKDRWEIRIKKILKMLSEQYMIYDFSETWPVRYEKGAFYTGSFRAPFFFLLEEDWTLEDPDTMLI